MNKLNVHNQTPKVLTTFLDGLDACVDDKCGWTAEHEKARTFIVRAVNSHEELIKSVKELRECLSNWMEIADKEDERDYDTTAIKNADKAIAKAEGK